MNSDAYDARLQHYLRRVLNSLPYNLQLQLKSLRLCQKSLIYQPGVEPGVFLLRNDRDGGEAKFFGQMTCKNPWACPHCTAVMMTKYKEKIAAAIEAMKEKDFFGFMWTFTIPHLRFQSCREVTDILYNTYRSVMLNCWSKRQKDFNVVHSFFKAVNMNTYVRVAEYTWGKNGWHPHFHSLYWFPKKFANFVDFADWEKRINKYWLTIAERETLKYWNANNLHGKTEEERRVKVKNLFMFKDQDKNPAIKFSMRDGKLCEAKSSEYLAGWGADHELTGNCKKKASHAAHLTPHEILEKAADGDKKMEELYIEFCLQVTRHPVHHRVDFKAGLNKIIVAYQQRQGFLSFVKKKKVVWELVCWFPKLDWWNLCDLDKESPVFSNILYLASINRKDLLKEYLQVFGIDLCEREHFFAHHILNIFNGECQAS